MNNKNINTSMPGYLIIVKKNIRWILTLLILLTGSGAFYAESELSQKKIELKYIDEDALKKQLSPFLSEKGKIERGNTAKEIIITDTVDNIKKIESAIKVMDVAPKFSERTAEINTDAEQQDRLLKEKEEEGNKMAVETVELKNISSMSARDILRDLFRNSGQNKGLTTGNVTIKELPEKNALVLMANDHDISVIKSSIKSIDVKGNGIGNGQEITTKVVFLQNTHVSEVLNALQQMKGENGGRRNGRNNEGNSTISDNIIIASLDNNNSIVLSGNQNDVSKVQGIIHQIDKVPRQVLIEIMILEVSLKNGTIGGVEWKWKKGDVLSKKGANQISTNYGIKPLADSGTANGFIFSYESEYFSAILQTLEESGDIRIVSAPHILVTNNQQAEIVIGDRVVINKESLEIPTADNSKPIIRTTRDYVDVGLRLQITPKINEDDQVYIDILQEVNDIKNSGIPGFPEIAKRSLKTNILVNNHESAVLGGLISKKKTKSQSKVGILGDLPIIGRLFRKDDILTQNNELVLFVTAYVVGSNGELHRITEIQKKKLQDIRLRLLKRDEKK